MLIPIPYGQSYTSNVSGSVTKLCHCEACAEEYVYTAKRQVSSSGMSFLWMDNEGAKDRAIRGAQAQIQNALAMAVDPVACPSCGWFQSNMQSQLKWRRLKWALWVSLPAAFFVLMTGIIRADEHWLVAALITAVGGIALGFVWSLQHDPNRAHGGPGGRNEVAAARSRGILRSVYEAQLSEQQRKFQNECHAVLMRSMLLVALADGDINDAEVASIAQFSSLGGGPAVAANTIRLDASIASSTSQEMQSLLAKLSPTLNSEGKKLFVKFGICVAAADGPINAQEQAAITFLVQALRMTPQDVQAAVQSMQQTVT
jgi:uncharacterized membrane protein YebE (DUF533 family)